MERTLTRRGFVTETACAAAAGQLFLGTLSDIYAEPPAKPGAGKPSPPVDSTLAHPTGKWRLGLNLARGIVHLGLDSEGTGREVRNLLDAPLQLSWPNAPPCQWRVNSDGSWTGAAGHVHWTVRRDGDDLRWDLECSQAVSGVSLTLPIDTSVTPVAFLPAKLASDNHRRLLVAPDLGHLLVECEGAGKWSLDANAQYDYVAQRYHYALRLTCKETLDAGAKTIVRLRPVELTPPPGLDVAAWRRVRRAYLNHWQPNAAANMGPLGVLANNVCSTPAAISLHFYSEPMLFWHELAPGIDVVPLLRYSLDCWLNTAVSFFGHVKAFEPMFDLYVCTGAHLVAAAWHYWTLTHDVEWLKSRIGILHRVADFLVRRDVDFDGLVESIHSGNTGGLREPDRADSWFEYPHFGHKNAYTNVHAYKAFLCMAQMLDATGHPKGGAYYRQKAKKLREAYVGKFLSPKNGWFVSWISQDGEIHDYCHTFINGWAVAFGIVPPQQGREILQRVVAKSKTTGFRNWHLGVQCNLLPILKGDLIGPAVGLDGGPEFSASPDLRKEDPDFGRRYTNGTVHPALTWPYLLGLQVAGLNEEADRILDAMIDSAQKGLFQNGVGNGGEHFTVDGKPCGYEGYLPENWNILMGVFTRDPKHRERVTGLFHDA